MKRIIWVLGDQLNKSSNLLANIDSNDLILFIESKAFASAHKHHKKKLIFQFSAMRHFADELKQAGHLVKYITFTETGFANTNIQDILQRVVAEELATELLMMKAADYDFAEIQKGLAISLAGCKVKTVANDLFLSNLEEFKTLFAGKKHLLMESYYRHLRKKHVVLMEKQGAELKPVGGKWNFDKENRKPLKTLPKNKFELAFNTQPSQITQQVIAEVEKHFPNHYGLAQDFAYAVTRTQALQQLSDFCANYLLSFGDYQDAMHSKDFYLYHSLLSYLMNFGLLHPMEVIRKIEEVYLKNPNTIPLNSAEGFIRQILGWREFIYCIYQSQMPKYRALNFFDNQRALPEFMWTAKTNMNCLRYSVQQTLEHAYAHHIQRLMVIGNFCLLAGLNPQEVCEWYLIVYVDALEWVELPNTLGMSQFADGGLFATKPYVSSGNYINCMSNYCETCHYNVKKTVGEEACPFNFLYWNFLAEKFAVLKSNPRMGIAMANVQRKTAEELLEIKNQARKFLAQSPEMKAYKPGPG